MISANLRERINWAINPFENGLTSQIVRTHTQTVAQIRNDAKKTEKEWGNKMIGQSNNGNWTTKLGEGLVFDILNLLDESPRKPEKKEGCNYEVDWETNNFMVEVKTSNWTISGTAGEKVLGTMYKYSDIPVIYGKKLLIVCVAYQEYELTYGPTKIFGEISDNKKKFIELANSMNIEYVKFSDLVAKVNI